MALDKLVDSSQLDADLLSVANAIRTKGGTSASLAFPAGFVSAVEAIPTGGGGASVDDLNSQTLSGAVTITGTSLRAALLLGCTDVTSVSCPNAKNGYGINMGGANRTGCQFKNCTSLASVDLPKLSSPIDNMFEGCRSLTTIKLPAATTIASNMAINCTGLKTAVFPAINGIVYATAFNGCSMLEAVDLFKPSFSRTQSFKNCTSLTSLIIRRTDAVSSLGNINNFDGTPFASEGTGGTLYVPNSMISSYQSATNWSTILGYANNQIKKIEGTIYETQYADGTPIT